MTVRVADQVRVEYDAQPNVNLIANHSGQNGYATGWSGTFSPSPVRDEANGYLGARAIKMLVTSSSSFPGLSTPPAAIVAGRWLGAQITLSRALITLLGGARGVRTRIEWFNATDTLISSTAWSYVDSPTNGQTLTAWSTSPVQAPAGTVAARLRVELYRGTQASPANCALGDSLTVAMACLVSASTSAGAAGVAFPSPVWRNITGSSVSAQIHRGGQVDGVTDRIEAGLCTVVVLDATVDPAADDTVRPGRAVRVTACAGNPAADPFLPIFTGRLTSVDVAYAEQKSRPGPPRVTLQASDAIAELVGIASPYAYGAGASYTAQVRALMAPSVVPFSVDGSDVAATVKTAAEDEGRLWDQLVLARNGHGPTARLYVDQAGTMQAHTATAGSPALTWATAAGAALSMTALDLNFGSKSCVNQLTITRKANDEDQGAKAYGPYAVPDSIATWGPFAAALDVIDGTPASLAAAYLAVYAVPAAFPASLDFNATHADAWAAEAAWAELYDVHRVIHGATDRNVYVIGIDHNIGPRRWTVRLTYRPTEATSTAAVVNDSGAGGPLDVVPPEPGPLASRYRSTDYTVANATWTTVPLDQVAVADQISYDTTGNSFEAPKAGRYLVAAGLRWTHNASGSRYIGVVVNGSTVVVRQGDGANSTSTDEGLTVAKVIKLAAGDTVSLQAYQSSGGSLDLNGDVASGIERSVFLDITWLGD